MRETSGYTAEQIDNLASMLGEGITASLRKFCESKASSEAYDAIDRMPDEEWDNGVLSNVIKYSILPWVEKNAREAGAS